jgi:hypothetical protein
MALIAELSAVYRQAGNDGRKTRGMASDVLRAVIGNKGSADWTDEDFALARKTVDDEKARAVAAPATQPAIPGVEE